MIGMMEYWKNGVMGLKKRFAHHSNIPSFHLDR
jgi:hypothetical protein